MKKRKLKNLKLNKKTISNFNLNEIQGGRTISILDGCSYPLCPDPSFACSELTVCPSINYCDTSQEFANQ